MNELPAKIEKAVRRYEAIEVCGLVLHPVKVKEYDEFLVARPALEVLHQSLPVAMMRIPLLSALYRIDYEAALSGKVPTRLFSRALLALALALRLGEGEAPEKRLGKFRVALERGRPEVLSRLIFTDEAGTEHEIDPAQYRELRRVIAAQNGVRVESDRANPHIVQAQKDLGGGGIALDATVYDLVSAVSALSGTAERDIDEWPILKLQARSESYKRMMDYLICGFGEMNGTTWKTGNPTPHPFFRRALNGGGLMTPMEGGQRKEIPGAVREIIRQTSDINNLKE